VYLSGPLVGALAAGGAISVWGPSPITGKLRHDPTIPCHMRCRLPHDSMSTEHRTAGEASG